MLSVSMLDWTTSQSQDANLESVVQLCGYIVGDEDQSRVNAMGPEALGLTGECKHNSLNCQCDVVTKSSRSSFVSSLAACLNQNKTEFILRWIVFISHLD